MGANNQEGRYAQGLAAAVRSRNAARRQTDLGVVAVLAGVLLSTPAWSSAAADSESTVAPKYDASVQLEEIIVTAQRRGQNLQDVPISVSSFSGSSLSQAGVETIADMGQVDPSLAFSTGPGVVLVFLRGTGNPSAITIGNEASVPVYIDDVYYSRLSTPYLELNNIDKVEVLKGPQGTLFGRNASGGAIQVFTRDPGPAPEFDATVGVANYETVTGKFYASTPVADRVAVDLSVSSLHQNGGWGKNAYDGSPTWKDQFISVRSKLVAEVSDSTKIKLSAFYVSQTNYQGIVAGHYRGTVAGSPPFLYGPSVPVVQNGFYNTDDNILPVVHANGYGFAANVMQDLGFAQLVSISAYRKATEHARLEGDYTSRDFLHYNIDEIDRQFSQEFQFKSIPEKSIPWIVGLYYLDTKQGNQPVVVAGDALTANGLQEQDIRGLQKLRSYSAYGQTTFPLIDNSTNLTLGLRYNQDRISGKGTQAAVVSSTFQIPAQIPYDKSFSNSKVTYKVALDHKFLEDVLGYVSYSRGYKSATFNTLPLDRDPTEPETVDSYEIGLKSEFLDKRVRLNAATFWNIIKNPQVQTIIQTGVTQASALTNAREAKVKGVELNVEARVTSGLQARVGATYIDGTYTDFKNAPFYFPNPNPPYGNFSPVAGDASGNSLAQTPKWRVTGGLNYLLDTASGQYTFDLNAAYTSSYSWDPDNILKQRAFTLVNASVLYQLPHNDNWSFQVWGKNLTGEQYYLAELPEAGFNGNISAPAAPRTFGIDVRFKFGQTSHFL